MYRDWQHLLRAVVLIDVETGEETRRQERVILSQSSRPGRKHFSISVSGLNFEIPVTSRPPSSSLSFSSL